MKKLIKTAAVLLMPTAMFAQIDGPFPLAQIDGPHSRDRDSICINRIELANIIDDLMEVDSWLFDWSICSFNWGRFFWSKP